MSGVVSQVKEVNSSCLELSIRVYAELLQYTGRTSSKICCCVFRAFLGWVFFWRQHHCSAGEQLCSCGELLALLWQHFALLSINGSNYSCGLFLIPSWLRVTAEVKHNPTNTIVCKAQGEWNGTLEFTYSNGETKVIDTNKLPVIRKKIRPIAQQGPLESRWGLGLCLWTLGGNGTGEQAAVRSGVVQKRLSSSSANLGTNAWSLMILKVF